VSNTFDDALGAFEAALPEGNLPVDEVPENQPTPEADAPEGVENQPDEGPASREIDLSGLPEEAQIFVRAREREMQRDYTRKTQELAQQRQEAEQYAQFVQALNSDPEFATAVLERLQAQLAAAGYLEQQQAADEYGLDDPDGWSDTEDDPYLKELQELKQWRDQVEAQWEESYQESLMNRQVAEIRSAHPEYDQADIEDIYALGFYTDGDLHKANDMFRGIIDRNLARYLESKRSVQTPAQLPSGQGVPAPDDLRSADDKQLREAALERLRSAIGQ